MLNDTIRAIQCADSKQHGQIVQTLSDVRMVGVECALSDCQRPFVQLLRRGIVTLVFEERCKAVECGSNSGIFRPGQGRVFES